MRTMLRKFKINHIQKDVEDFVLKDGKGRSFRVPKSDVSPDFPSNLRLKFRPARLNVTYIYGTNIVLEMRLNGALLYWQSEKKFPEWERFFKTYSNTDAEIELSVRHFDERADILLWNLAHQENDVFKFREQLLLSSYCNDLPRMISRLKIENSLIFAVKAMRSHFAQNKHEQKSILLHCFENYANLPSDLPFFVDWCLEEMEILNKLYKQDLSKKITVSNLGESQILKHTSKLIPICISDEKISEFMNSESNKKRDD